MKITIARQAFEAVGLKVGSIMVREPITDTVYHSGKRDKRHFCYARSGESIYSVCVYEAADGAIETGEVEKTELCEMPKPWR